MEFGISFFPNVGEAEKLGWDYWNEALSLVDLCDSLGYTHVRTVEHYFHATAVTARTRLCFCRPRRSARSTRAW